VPLANFVSARSLAPRHVPSQGWPFSSLWSGGCAQPSDSPSRDPERFRECDPWSRPDSGAACSSLLATSDSLARQCLWPSVWRQVSRSSAGPPCGRGLLVHAGGAVVRNRRFHPHGLLRVFESFQSIFHPDGPVAGYGLSATPESMALQRLWPPCSRQFSPSSAHSSCEEAFLFALVWRLFTAVAFSLAGSRAFSRVAVMCTGQLGGFLRFASYP